MNEKELLKQLNNLKNFKPDSSWKAETREILYNRISAATEDRKVSLVKLFRATLPQFVNSFVAQPGAVVAVIILIALGGGVFSLQASRDTVPGDSLYVAKMVSEKTQMALTFDTKERTKLRIEFAGNRAREISRVLSAPEDEVAKGEKVAKLTEDFKKEIAAARSDLNVIRPSKTSYTDNEPVEATEENTVAEQEEEVIEVFSADIGNKEENGLQIAEPSGSGSGTVAADDPEGESATAVSDLTDEAEENAVSEEGITADTGSTSEEVDEEAGDEAEGGVTVTEETAEEGSTDDPQSILDEAEKLLLENDIDGTLDKLKQANDLIDNTDETGDEAGQVQGASEAATTSEISEGEGQVLGVSEEFADEDASSTD